MTESQKDKARARNKEVVELIMKARQLDMQNEERSLVEQFAEQFAAERLRSPAKTICWSVQSFQRSAMMLLGEEKPGIYEETWIGCMIWNYINDKKTVTCGDVTLTGCFRYSPVDGCAPFVVIDYAERGKVIRNFLRRRCKCYVVHWLLAEDGCLYELLYDVEPYLTNSTLDQSYTEHPQIIYKTNGYPLVDGVSLPVEDRGENILVADDLPDWLGGMEDAE